jgi:N-acyl-D-aspartate/D-glutamate deacylase
VSPTSRFTHRLVTLAPSENFGGTLREQGITQAAAANTTGLASVPPMDSIIIRLFDSKNGRKGMNHGDTWPVTFMRYPLTLVLALALCSLMMPVPGIGAPTYDVVIAGGRVLDPESGLDAVRTIGISGGRIARITEESLVGRRVVDAKGLVVSPGFIDLHQHGQDEESGRLKAFDGVTTALEMEIGRPDLATFLRQKAARSLINYGATASHAAARALAFGVPLKEGILPMAGTATNLPASDEQLSRIEARLQAELDAGALGIGMGIQYTPGASRLEVIRMFRLAAKNRAPIFTHVRSFGRLEPGSSIEAVSEVIGAAAVTGASLHIVHVNSSCLQDGLECLSLVAGARARGLDITTEAYPYIAGMTEINSALFNPGWRDKLGLGYDALAIPETGERLTQERFEALHASAHLQKVLLFMNSQTMVDSVIVNPLVMVASDGELGHPRNAGTYARILAHYVRDQRSLALMDGIRKMSLMPAQRLESSTSAARRKGRLQEGADADVVVFDPSKIVDRSTYEMPNVASTGMRFVIVGGVLLIDQGKLVSNTYAGTAICRTPCTNGGETP